MLVLIRKTGWIRKYSVGTAKLCCTGIHHLNETIDRTTDMLGELKGNIVCRCEHDRIQTLLYGKHFINLRGDIGTSVCDTGYTGCSHGDLIGKLCVFQCK